MNRCHEKKQEKRKPKNKQKTFIIIIYQRYSLMKLFYCKYKRYNNRRNKITKRVARKYVENRKWEKYSKTEKKS